MTNLRARIGRAIRRAPAASPPSRDGEDADAPRTLEDLAVAQREVAQRLDDLRAEVAAASALTRSLLGELEPGGGPEAAGDALRIRLEHGLLHAEAVAKDSTERFARELGDLRSTTRLTQALVERLLDQVPPEADPTPRPSAGTAPVGASLERGCAFTHPVPSFELLYRAFEDHHRGSGESISDRARADYLELLQALPHPDLPIADLGCGRGELVRLLLGLGTPAVGIDSNYGQLADGGDDAHFVGADVFDWLDEQPDGSLRAVMAMHLIEHLPLDLQLRLVFEARRVTAEGGALIVETPNALSLATAATNFWVDPTHVRIVHPLFLEFLAHSAGFSQVELRPLHPVPVTFRGAATAPELVEDLNSLILGAGDMAVVAWR